MLQATTILRNATEYRCMIKIMLSTQTSDIILFYDKLIVADKACKKCFILKMQLLSHGRYYIQLTTTLTPQLSYN